MMLESAVNSTLIKSNLFPRELKLMEPNDMKIFIEQFNMDWKIYLDLFKPVFEFIYALGKKEKLENISKDDIGIIKF